MYVNDKISIQDFTKKPFLLAKRDFMSDNLA